MCSKASSFRNYATVDHVITCQGGFSPCVFLRCLSVLPRSLLQLRNKLNQEQNAKLQQQRECLNKRNSEVAVMDRRVSELRDRLWKKKAALQQKENLPVRAGCSRWAGRATAPSSRAVLQVALTESEDSRALCHCAT